MAGGMEITKDRVEGGGGGGGGGGGRQYKRHRQFKVNTRSSSVKKQDKRVNI